LVSVARGKRKEQVEAKRKLCNENGGISLVGDSQAQKCIQLYELRIPKHQKGKREILGSQNKTGMVYNGHKCE